MCPSCNGKGQFESIVCINRGYKPHQWKHCFTPCEVCDGKGNATEEDVRRFESGRKLRAERIKRRETLGDCARRMGISAVELSTMESGRRP